MLPYGASSVNPDLWNLVDLGYQKRVYGGVGGQKVESGSGFLEICTTDLLQCVEA